MLKLKVRIQSVQVARLFQDERFCNQLAPWARRRELLTVFLFHEVVGNGKRITGVGVHQSSLKELSVRRMRQPDVD